MMWLYGVSIAHIDLYFLQKSIKVHLFTIPKRVICMKIPMFYSNENLYLIEFAIFV